jgi:uncharacterized protein
MNVSPAIEMIRRFVTDSPTRMQHPRNWGPDPYHGLMTLPGGRTFDLRNAQPHEIRIEDIALSLSRQCRYVGHPTQFYSVAQHVVLVSHLVPPPLAPRALLHDSEETYTGDQSRPFASLCGMEAAKVADALRRKAYEAFGLDPNLIDDRLRLADNLALAWEMRDLMDCPPPAEIARILPDDLLLGMEWPEARALFLDRYAELFGSGPSGTPVPVSTIPPQDRSSANTPFVKAA